SGGRRSSGARRGVAGDARDGREHDHCRRAGDGGMNVEQREIVVSVLDTILHVTNTSAAERHYHRQTWIGHLARLEGLTVETFLADIAGMDEAIRGTAMGPGVAALS